MHLITRTKQLLQRPDAELPHRDLNTVAKDQQQNAIAVQKAVATADAEHEAMLERLEEAHKQSSALQEQLVAEQAQSTQALEKQTAGAEAEAAALREQCAAIGSGEWS